MSRLSRGDVVDLTETGIYHCWSRCVRSALLFGEDPITGKDFGYRCDWMEKRIESLAGLFAIDVCFFAIMMNHFHLILRILPELLAKWSDKQVVKRAIKIFPNKFKELGVRGGEATQEQVRNFAKDKKLVNELRSRLANPSWFLRQLKQNIAQRANAEEQLTGHFWQGRFDCKRLVDEIGVLVCGMYVDLNEIRAGIAKSLDASKRTSAYRRLEALRRRRQKKRGAADIDGFLCPVSTQGDGQSDGYQASGTLESARVSDGGLFEFSVEAYLELLDWTGRLLVEGKASIPAEEPPILEKMGITGEALKLQLEVFESLRGPAIGRPENVRRFVEALG